VGLLPEAPKTNENPTKKAIEHELFEKAPDWQPFSIVDGRLITGQNPASSTVAAQALLKMVGQKAA
jgi:putative intracellular protease/amidase